jgi:alkylation response protein AidB-like acyl-CoA dehydrogenase
MPTDLFSEALSHATTLSPRLFAIDEPSLPSILREVRSFCAKHVDPAHLDKEGKLGGDLLALVAEQGWFGLTTPAEHGGAGLSMAASSRIIAELASHDGSLGTCVGLHSGLALHGLVHQGSEALRARYLPEIAEGKRICAFAATEPGAGSDISAVKTTLSEVDGKLRLTGSKVYVTNGGMASLVTALARSPGLGGAKAGHTLVLVDTRWPGVKKGAEEKKLGLKASSTITIDFDDVEIPADHVLGEPSQGLAYAHKALGWGRTYMAAGCFGVARAALAATREHVATRQQFGRPLAKFTLVRDSIATMRAEAYAIESVLRLVAAYEDAGLGDIGQPSSVLKVLGSEGAWYVIDRGIQLFGGAGFLEEIGMARRLRDVRVTRIFEGANDVLRLHLASAALAWPIATMRELKVATGAPAHLASEAAAIDGALSRLTDALEQVRKLGFRVYEKQVLQYQLADALISAFTAMTVYLRAVATPDDEAALAVPRLAIALHARRSTDASARALEPADKARDRLIELAAADET